MSQYDGQAATFVPGRLRGYREWRIRDMGGEGDPLLGLESLTYTTVWPWTPAMRATCRVDRSLRSIYVAHEPPVKGCRCGIYAKHKPDDMRHTAVPVMGAIEAWGRVEVGPWGFRAELARISGLWVKPHMVPAPGCAPSPLDLQPGQSFEYTSTMLTRWVESPELTAAIADHLSERYRVPVYPSYEALVSDFPPIDIAELLGHRNGELG